MAQASPIPSPRRKRRPSKHVALRSLSLRESNVIQVTFSAYETDFWKLYWTKGGRFVMPTHEAARYVMVRLYDTARRERTRHKANAHAARRVADMISVELPD